MPELDPDPPSVNPPRCPEPADFRAAVASYDERARVERWAGPRHEMTYRVLGDGPPLVLCPGIASTYRSYALLLNHLAARFETIQFDYPGEQPDDRARLGRITHEHLVDDLFGLLDHLKHDRAGLVGLSFGSTVVLQALRRAPARFPRAAIQGGFAHRRFTTAERLALAVGRRVPGHVGRLPLHDTVLAWNNKAQFPPAVLDRWPYYVAQNALTPIAPLAHRLDLLARLDLRPVLPEIRNEVLLLQGTDDRIVARRYFDELRQGLPHATGVLMPNVGHQPHFTHAEALAGAIAAYCEVVGDPGRDRVEDV